MMRKNIYFSIKKLREINKKDKIRNTTPLRTLIKLIKPHNP